MQDFVHFLYAHWVLVAVGAVAFGLILKEDTQHARGGKTNLSPEQVVQMLNSRQPTVIDIRESEQFNAGHIIHANRVDPNELETMLTQFKQDKPIIVVCQRGKQSIRAALGLRKQGARAVFTLEGGIDAWSQSGLPLVS